MACSCAIDHLRRRKATNQRAVQEGTHIVDQKPDRTQNRPDHTLENRTLRQDLLNALGQLPENQRTVFHLSEIEGLSYAEIARVMDISPGTIASRKHHAVRKIRQLLRRQGHGA